MSGVVVPYKLISDSALSATSKIVYVSLKAYSESGMYFASTELLVRTSGLSRNSVAKHLRILRSQGWIDYKDPGTGNTFCIYLLV